MAGNRAVAYMEPGRVEVQTIDYPKLELQDRPGVNPANIGPQVRARGHPQDRRDQHLRERPAHGPRPHHRPAGLVLGHEITGEVIEAGRDVEFIKVGDLVSVPFNIACGRCRNCKEGKTGICLNVNPARPGAAYGYVDMGGWVGGQAEYVMVPYADFNLLKFPDKDQAMAKIRDLTLLSDIFPTGYHGAVTAGVGTGSIVYVAGAGPVGLACALGCQLLGAAVVIVGDMIPERLAQAKSFGCETIDLRRTPRSPSRSSRSWAFPRWTARWTAWASRRADTARTPARPRRPCSTSLMDRDAGRRRHRHPRPVRDRRPGRHG